MRTVMIALAVSFLMSPAAWAQDDMVRQARDACRAGDFVKGINAAIDAGMRSQVRGPAAPWRRALDGCFRAWVKDTVKRCGALDPAAPATFGRILSKARYTAGPRTKKAIAKGRLACVRAASKTVARARDGATLLKGSKFLESAAREFKGPRVRRAVAKGRKVLDRKWRALWKRSARACLARPTLEGLKALDTLASVIAPQGLAAEQYHACVKGILDAARRMCNAGRVKEGALLLKEGRARLRNMRPRDEVLISQVKEWAPECGIVDLTLEAVLEAWTGGYHFVVVGKGRFTVRKVRGNEVQACGDFTTMDFHTRNSRGCQVDVIVERDRKGLGPEVLPQRVCLTGTIKEVQGHRRELRLRFDTLVARTMFSEVIQERCPGKPARVFREHLIEDLISLGEVFKFRGLLDLKMPVRRTTFRNFGHGRKVQWKATWRIVPLR